MTGYKSKRAAAQDKLEQNAFNDWWGSDYDDSTNPCIEGTPVYWAWAGWQAALAQPEQEPKSVTYKEVADTMNALRKGTVEQRQIAAEMENKRLYTTPQQPALERNFCPRCGKRTKDIHICTPPQENT